MKHLPGILFLSIAGLFPQTGSSQVMLYGVVNYSASGNSSTPIDIEYNSPGIAVFVHFPTATVTVNSIDFNGTGPLASSTTNNGGVSLVTWGAVGLSDGVANLNINVTGGGTYYVCAVALHNVNAGCSASGGSNQTTTTNFATGNITIGANEIVLGAMTAAGSSATDASVPAFNDVFQESYVSPYTLPLVGADAAYPSVAGTYNFQWTMAASTSGVAGYIHLCGVADLPIELKSYSANYIKEHSDVRVAWTTSSETNNHFFTVERSEDGMNYVVLGTVPGAGNSSEPLDYSLIDNNPLPGTSYYRLKQTDYNGNFKYNGTVVVNCPFISNLTVFSDKSGSAFHFYTEQESPVQADIYNMQGSLISTNLLTDLHRGENEQKLMTSLPTGLYILTLREGSQVVTRKFLSQ